MPPLSLLSNFGLAVGTMPTHRVMRVVRPAFGAEVSQSFFKSVGRQPEARLQASRGILRRAANVISHPDCCFKRRGVTLGVARVVRAVALGAPSHRRAGTARPSSPLHGGAALHVQAVRGRAAAAQAPSPCGVGPVRARRSATVVRAAPYVVRAARDAPRPLRLESSGRAAPLPVRDECGFQCAPQPRTAECCKVETVARAHGAPRQFTETIIDVQLCLLLSSYIILCGSATSACVQLARGRAAAAQGSSILMEWARYWFDGRSQRFGPCRSSLALPLTRLARWGWRAAGAQRLSRSGMSAAGGMRLSRWRLSAARSSPVRGLVAHLVNSPRTRRGDFRRPRRKQTSCWPKSRLGF